ncbi:MAG: hypothetical protein EON58_16825 [Alphaproteobacteria bacterium]|nr:MAG: hypothetical protein EON58_16825 [Alphaproteobacteria bacterium]
MKVRIQNGSASIEIEGEETEVSSILDKWWHPSVVITPANEEFAEDAVPKSPKRRSIRRSATKGPATTREGTSKINAEEIANQIKVDPRFSIFKDKIVVGDASRSDRAKFVSWIVGDQYITSGDVLRVMVALSVKFDAPKASKAITDEPSDWLKDTSGPQAAYKLSAAAREEFEKRLLGAEKSAA